MPSEYRLSQPLLVRSLGALLVVVGVAVFVLALVVALLRLPVLVLTVGVVVAVAVVLASGLLLSRVATVVRLDDTGYQVRLLRHPGVRAARWRDVEDVVTATLSDQRCVVLRLRDGRTTTVPVALVAGSPEAFVKDLGEHLNRGHGYRKLR